MTTLSSPPPSPLIARSASNSSSGSGHMPLGVSNVANLLVKMRRHRKKAKEHHIESSSADGPLTHPSLTGENVVSARKVPLEEHQTFICRDGVDTAKLVRAVRGSLYQKALDVGANVLVDEQCVFLSKCGSLCAVLTRPGNRWTCTICGPRHRSDGTFRVHVSVNHSTLSYTDPRRASGAGSVCRRCQAGVSPNTCVPRPVSCRHKGRHDVTSLPTRHQLSRGGRHTDAYSQIHYSAQAARSNKPDPQHPVALQNAKGVPGLMTIVSRLD